MFVISQGYIGRLVRVRGSQCDMYISNLALITDGHQVVVSTLVGGNRVIMGYVHVRYQGNR